MFRRELRHRMATIVTLLASDLLAWLRQQPDGVARRVLLWLDPAAEFARLAPEDGVGQLAVKLELLRAGEHPADSAHALGVTHLRIRERQGHQARGSPYGD